MPKKGSEEPMTADNLQNFTVAQLKAELTKRDLDTKGVKAALVARLKEAMEGESPQKLSPSAKEPGSPGKPVSPAKPAESPAKPKSPTRPGSPAKADESQMKPGSPIRSASPPKVPESPQKPMSPAKVPESPQKPASPAKAPESPKKPASPAKVPESPKKPMSPANAPESPKKPASPAKVPESPKKPASPTKAPESPQKPASPAKADEPSKSPSKVEVHHISPKKDLVGAIPLSPTKSNDQKKRPAESPSSPSKRQKVEDGPKSVLMVTNFTRPLNIEQLKAKLAEYGNYNRFWIDKLRKVCYTFYESVEMAVSAQKNLHDTVYQTNGKKLEAHTLTIDSANAAIAADDTTVRTSSFSEYQGKVSPATADVSKSNPELQVKGENDDVKYTKSKPSLQFSFAKK